MLIGIIGENCSGKSTLAEQIRAELGGEIVAGRDYLRMARSESQALLLFRKKLESAVSGDNLIYLIAEREQIGFLPEGAVRILVTADLDTIKARFRARMRGNLPAPVEKMLEAKHGMFDAEPCDYRFDGASGDPQALCAALKAR
jgi:adenylate kinase family enzyme